MPFPRAPAFSATTLPRTGLSGSFPKVHFTIRRNAPPGQAEYVVKFGKEHVKEFTCLKT